MPVVLCSCNHQRRLKLIQTAWKARYNPTGSKRYKYLGLAVSSRYLLLKSKKKSNNSLGLLTSYKSINYESILIPHTCKKLQIHVNLNQKLYKYVFNYVCRVGYKERFNTVEMLCDCSQWGPLTILRVALIDNNHATFLQC